MSTQLLYQVACQFAAYLFLFRGLQPSTIRTYLSGVNHHLSTADVISGSIWTPQLNQVLRGIDRLTSFESALINRAKLPFTLPLILLARDQVLLRGATFQLRAIFAALCLGFMFLLRKSEFLTNAAGVGNEMAGIRVTLEADNVHLWWGDVPYASTARYLPDSPPDYISIFLPRQKGDQLGKGATRFFPRQPGSPICLVTIIYEYVMEARLNSGSYFFASSSFIVSATLVTNTMKSTSAIAGLPADRVGLHSLRVGGLVALFAANASAHLMVLAGRWASEKSFVQYMRATMEQYNTIAAALNNVNLVTPDHIRQLYVPSCPTSFS